MGWSGLIRDNQVGCRLLSLEIQAGCCETFRFCHILWIADSLLVKTDYLTDVGCNSSPSAVILFLVSGTTALGPVWWVRDCISASRIHIAIHKVPLPGLSQGQGRGVSDGFLQVSHGACSRLVLADTTSRVHKDVP